MLFYRIVDTMVDNYRPEVDKLSERLDELEEEVFEKPNTQLARRILKTGSPQYRSAFRKWMSGSPMTGEEQRAFALNTTGILTHAAFNATGLILALR